MTNATLRMVGTLFVLAGLAMLTGAVPFPSLGDSPPPPSSSAYDSPHLSPSDSTIAAPETIREDATDRDPIPEDVSPVTGGLADVPGWGEVGSSADDWCESDASCPTAVASEADEWCDTEGSCLATIPAEADEACETESACSAMVSAEAEELCDDWCAAAVSSCEPYESCED